MTALLAPLAFLGPAELPPPCVGLRAIDGDTALLACEAGPERVRLADVDAPEIDGACRAERVAALAAARALEAWVAGVPLWIDRRGRDGFGRTVAFLDDGSGDLGDALVAEGLAARWPHDDAGAALAPRPDWCAPD